MKRILASILALIICFSLFSTGCSQKTDESSSPTAGTDGKAAPAEKVSLNYTYWSDEDSYLKKVMEAFNKLDPNVQVKGTIIPSQEYDDKIKVLLAGGADMDILSIRGVQQLNQYVAGGMLAKLSELITENGVDVTAFGPMYKQSAIDNVQYGMPYRNSCWFLIYNKDIFDKAGIAYPQQMTYDEFAELGKKLTTGEGADKQWGIYLTPWVYNMLAIQRGATLLDDDTSALKESLEFHNRLYNVDKTAMSAAEMTATNSNWIAEFENGKAAMMINGDWFIGMIKADEAAGKSTVKWDLAPLPVPGGVEAGTSFGHYTYIGMPERGKYKDQAFLFLKYLCGEDGAKILAGDGFLTAYNNDSIREAFVTSAGKDSVSVLFNSKMVDEQPFHPKVAEVADAMREQAEMYLLGEKSIDDAMKDFESKRSDILKK